MPFGGGWAEQPTHLVEIIDVLDGMFKQWENKPQPEPGTVRRK